MIYLPDLHYFFDQKDFPLEKAVLVTAKKVGEWCGYYKARLIAPRQDIKEIERQGRLPATTAEKHKFITDLVGWIFSDSATEDLFALFLQDSEIAKDKDKPVKFDHHDDTCCWALNLSEDEFTELQSVWKANELPTDLFYPENKAIRIVEPKGKAGRFFGKLGFTVENSKVYSPKRWEAEQEK